MKLNLSRSNRLFLFSIFSVFISLLCFSQDVHSANRSANYLFLGVSQNTEIPSTKVTPTEAIADSYLSSGSYSKAIKYYERAYEDDSTEKDLHREANYLRRTKLAFALMRAGRLEEAEKELLETMELQERFGPGWLSRVEAEFLELQNRSSLYDVLTLLYAETDRYEKALEITDRGRSVVYASKLTQFSIEETRSDKNPISHKDIGKVAEQQDSTIVTYAVIRIDFPNIELNNYTDELFIWLTEPTGKTHFERTKIDFSSWYEVGSEIAKSTQENSPPLSSKRPIVSWLVISRFLLLASILSSVFAFSYIKRNGLQKYIVLGCLISSSTFVLTFTDVESISGLSRGGDNVSSSEIKACSASTSCLEKLYDRLILPVQEYLPEKGKELIFIPHREIHTIPFMALVKNDKYLIEDYAIRVSPSIRVLSLLAQEASNRSVAVSESLVVGNPDIHFSTVETSAGPEDLVPLPGAEEEARAVAEILNTEPLIGSEATKEAIINRLSNSKYIHLATHGLLLAPVDNSLEYPGFLVTPSIEDGFQENAEQEASISSSFLTTEDIYQTNLNANLAVLSACETSIGEVTIEGNLSLGLPFLMNGVPSVIASLWRIEDESTKEIMIEFYKSENSNKSYALRQAVLTVMKQYPGPQQWGGFLLLGLSQVLESNELQNQGPSVTGKMSCTPAAAEGNLNYDAYNIVEATLKPSASGFTLSLTRDDERTYVFELYDNLAIKEAYIDGGNWNLVAYYASNNPFQINPDGDFGITMLASTRSACTFEGKLQFLENSKEILFN